MNKKKINFQALMRSHQENCARISEIADLCEKESREMNEAEKAEYAKLLRENQMMEMRLHASASDYIAKNDNESLKREAVDLIRDNARNGKKTEIMFVRDIMMVTDMANSGTIPLNIQDILEPLVEGLILNQVGLPFMTGLAGDYVWPVYEMVEATVLGEGVALTDTKIPFSKLQANPARCGIAIPVSNQSLTQTDGLLEQIVRQIMPQSIQILLNKILFSTEAVNATAQTAGLVGPFVAALGSKVNLSATPKFKELNSDMKAAVLSTGVDGANMCWVMSKSMKAILEGEPINSSGVYVPMVQNDRLCGLPIYTSEAIRKIVKVGKKYSGSAWSNYTIQAGDTVKYKVSGDTEAHALAKISGMASGDIALVSVVTEFIGLGDWRYQPMGLFGSIRFTVDPYSQARKDAVDFVLNCDYGTKTLRPEAFCIGQVAVSN